MNIVVLNIHNNSLTRAIKKGFALLMGFTNTKEPKQHFCAMYVHEMVQEGTIHQRCFTYANDEYVSSSM